MGTVLRSEEVAVIVDTFDALLREIELSKPPASSSTIHRVRDSDKYLPYLNSSPHSPPQTERDTDEVDSESTGHPDLRRLLKRAQSARSKMMSSKVSAKVTPGDNEDKEAAPKTPKAPQHKGDRTKCTAEKQRALEKNFTTNGRPGDLRCPFASHSRPLKTNNEDSESRTVDPIAAELEQDKSTYRTDSVSASAPKCPIRFLDQHSPEEIAEYFEKHKHEIPRSHEICVKRYQSNEESIRQLDAKYGSLVSMIQGLGMKHQPLLPSNEEDGIEAPDEKAQQESVQIEKWANGVDERNSAGDVGEGSQRGEEERVGHFDRPLKEIRVGESPSRPWGLSVPPQHYEAGGLLPEASTHPKAEATKTNERAEQPKRCPFGFDQVKSEASHTRQRPTERGTEKDVRIDRPVILDSSPPKTSTVEQGPKMVFTGPVFIGYPIEQAMQFMQHYKPSDGHG